MESACKIAYCRGKLTGEIKTNTQQPGAMMSVNLSEEEAMGYVRSTNSHGRRSLHIACINSRTNCTLSGDESAIDELKQRLDNEQIFAQKLNTGIAYHSPAMQAVASEYREMMGRLPMAESSSAINMVSSVTGKRVSPVELVEPQYWVENLVSPVRFYDGLIAVVQNDSKLDIVGNETISDVVEIGPHCALRRPIRDTLSEETQRKRPLRYTYALERNRSAIFSLLSLVGHLYCHGYPVSVAGANQQAQPGSVPVPILTDLPKYPFDHSRKYWDESRLSRDYRLRPHGPNDMLGVPSHDWNPLEPRWRNLLSIENMPWLGGYVVRTMLIVWYGYVVAKCVFSLTARLLFLRRECWLWQSRLLGRWLHQAAK